MARGVPRVQGVQGSFASRLIHMSNQLTTNPQFVEDEGSVVFYKNAHGLAQVRPALSEGTASDSGIEITDSKL